MNKTDLVNAMSAKSNLSKVDCKKALEAYMEICSNALKKGERVALVGFGTFSVQERAARKGHNPRTGKTIDIKAKKVVKFRPGDRLL